MAISLSKQRKALVIAVVLFSVFFFMHLIPNRNIRQSALQSLQEMQSDVPAQIHLSDPIIPPWENKTRANAAFVILTRNSELDALRKTIQQLEARFNSKFNYPYIFLNDEEFTEEFRELTMSMTNAKTEYGLIPKEHWSFPDWIDVKKAAEERRKMGEQGIIYGDSLSYRHMCRFNSGFFYRHPLLLGYDYYWRVEPGVDFFCDIDYDPFLFMQENNKKYGWTIALIEFESTIPTLWKTTLNFMKEYPQHIPKNNLMNFVSDNGGRTYNLCHFWSNFEIADLNFLRSPAYSDYFNYLDKAGGFFYERWGDAPVHSIAVGMFLNKSEVHFFDDIGYRHDPFNHCPTRHELQKKCHCNADDSFDFTINSCMPKWLAA